MVYKWREGQTPIFLQLFRSHECLWNHKSEAYKNRDVRASAIRSFIAELNIEGITEVDIRLKIKSIRTRYAAELAKIKKSERSGVAEVYVPKLFWFEQADSFLSGVCTPRPSSSNLCMLMAESTAESMIDSKEYIDDGDLGSVSTSDLPLSSIATSSRDPLLRSYRKRRATETVNNTTNKLRNVSDDSEDEFDLFCRSLAVQLKKMPLYHALQCQKKLQSVMVDERLSSMAIPSVSHSPTYD